MTNVPDRLDPSALRASDSDRERVAEVLRQAAAEGRLDLGELDERLAVVYAAKTYGELVPLTRDLPSPTGAPPVPVHVRADGSGMPTSRGAIALMSGFKRAGRWAVARRFTCLAFWGGGVIDLREAVFVAGEVRIRAIAIMGGVEVFVPEASDLHVTGIGIMGGFEHGASGSGEPDAPRIVVSGLAFWGGVSVKRKASQAELKRRRSERKDRKLEGFASDD